MAKLPIPTFAGVDTGARSGGVRSPPHSPRSSSKTQRWAAACPAPSTSRGLTAINGTYDVQLVDSTGGLLASVTDTAVAGATFSQSIPFRHPYSGTGTIQVFARPAGPSQPPEATQFSVQVTP